MICLMNSRESSGYLDLADRLAHGLREEPQILAAYLHGSFGTPAFRKDSDVDVAILLFPGQALSAVERLNLESMLGGLLGVSLDLGVLTTRNLVYFIQAVHNGHRVFCRDKSLADALVAKAFSLYGKLKEDRREVEAAYHVA